MSFIAMLFFLSTDKIFTICTAILFILLEALSLYLVLSRVSYTSIQQYMQSSGKGYGYDPYEAPMAKYLAIAYKLSPTEDFMCRECFLYPSKEAIDGVAAYINQAIQRVQSRMPAPTHTVPSRPYAPVRSVPVPSQQPERPAAVQPVVPRNNPQPRNQQANRPAATIQPLASYGSVQLTQPVLEAIQQSSNIIYETLSPQQKEAACWNWTLSGCKPHLVRPAYLFDALSPLQQHAPLPNSLPHQTHHGRHWYLQHQRVIQQLKDQLKQSNYAPNVVATVRAKAIRLLAAANGLGASNNPESLYQLYVVYERQDTVEFTHWGVEILGCRIEKITGQPLMLGTTSAAARYGSHKIVKIPLQGLLPSHSALIHKMLGIGNM